VVKVELRDEINKRKKDGWIEAWFAIEALAVSEDVVKSALENHVKKMHNIKDALIYEKKFSDIKIIEKPLKNMEKGYSQIVELKLFIKNLLTLIRIVMLYGPSSIEILGPNELKIKIDEVQNIANLIATLVHQFASAGVGGIVISPEK
jgi:hypothetical protein